MQIAPVSKKSSSVLVLNIIWVGGEICCFSFFNTVPFLFHVLVCRSWMTTGSPILNVSLLWWPLFLDILSCSALLFIKCLIVCSFSLWSCWGVNFSLTYLRMCLVPWPSYLVANLCSIGNYSVVVTRGVFVHVLFEFLHSSLHLLVWLWVVGRGLEPFDAICIKEFCVVYVVETWACVRPYDLWLMTTSVIALTTASPPLLLTLQTRSNQDVLSAMTR